MEFYVAYFFCEKKGDFNLQFAVPDNLAETIILQFHDNLLSHQGAVRSCLIIRRYFYMPLMFERINKLCQIMFALSTIP